MLWIVTAAVLSSAQVPEREASAVQQGQARAVIRIIRAATVHFGDERNVEQGEAVKTKGTLEGPDGLPRPSELVEFY